MASIFTYQDEPHRVHSPWSTPGSSTPQVAIHVQGQTDALKFGDPSRIAKLEPEKHDGPIEYKLHLLLRWRRTFTHSTTSMPAWSGHHARDSLKPLSNSQEERTTSRSTYQPSSQTRQARLQQLTTQLLWRLQQSSPFHSSSNAKLVLPVLPEATPRLGVPERPSKLLPGLEESQGALYEIGVADDGTLVGLSDEELEESLINLRAMAASLGCVVDVHRRVIVGDCAWMEDSTTDGPSLTHSSKLWVAEVLVRPDNKSVEVIPTANINNAPQLLDLDPAAQQEVSRRELSKEHLRVALLGASTSGKSSLLGTLTTSILDNGRGKSRLSLLKHRHEIASGITSSVAQELIGYQMHHPQLPAIVNYATGDVSSWPDIHNLASRLVFLSDSPGLPRYAKSTLRSLISWDPAWIMLCVPADASLENDPLTAPSFLSQYEASNGPKLEPNLSMTHLTLCLKLDRPFIVVITKMDVATKTGLRQVLTHILSLTKAAGKTPVLMNTPSSQPVRDDSDFAQRLGDLVRDEQSQIENKLNAAQVSSSSIVPIVMTSSVTGSGIANLHCLLRSLPECSSTDATLTVRDSQNVMFRTDEVFAIPPSKVYSSSTERTIIDNGVVLCGILNKGTICLGDELFLGPFVQENELHDAWQIRAMRRSSSHQGKPAAEPMIRTLSENFSKSLQLHNGYRHDHQEHEPENKVIYVKVRVVSLRNLRLPVTILKERDTGTVGIQMIDTDIQASEIQLNRARKGMILTRRSSTRRLHAYKSFTATFPYTDFSSSTSPPLILGGHAIVYINSIRSAVKVIAVALEDLYDNTSRNGTTSQHQTAHEEVFCFDEDDDTDVRSDMDITNNSPPSQQQHSHLKISFKFVSTMEYFEKDDQVLVVPNTTPAGPIAGPASTSSIAGLSGFVGRICNMSV